MKTFLIIYKLIDKRVLMLQQKIRQNTMNNVFLMLEIKNIECLLYNNSYSKISPQQIILI